jgi:hypothetical protein
MPDIAGVWYLSTLKGTEEIEAKLFEVFRDTDPPYILGMSGIPARPPHSSTHMTVLRAHNIIPLNPV